MNNSMNKYMKNHLTCFYFKIILNSLSVNHQRGRSLDVIGCCLLNKRQANDVVKKIKLKTASINQTDLQ